MEFTVLGPLGVSCDGTPVPLGSRKQRAVLAILLLRANEVVPADVLIDELWGERPPPSAAHTLQAYISRLRVALRSRGAPDGVLVTRPAGYMLRVGFRELDLERFETLAAEGRRSLESGAPARAAERLSEALALWKGPPLADLAFESFARVDVERLEEQRLAALEDRIEADLALGRHSELVVELKELIERYPLRERLREHLMLALYRAGRQAEALESYRDSRDYLVGELGLEPSKALQALEQAVLRQDDALDLDGARETAQASTLTITTERHGRAGEADGDGWEASGPAPVAPLIDDPVLRPRVPMRRRALAGAGVFVLAGAIAAALVLRDGSESGQALAASALDANAIVAVDTVRLTAVAQRAIGGRPAGISLGAGALWAADAANDRVLRLDPRSYRVEDRIPVGRNPGGIAAGPDGVWVANTGSGTVSEINPESGTTVATIRVGNAPVAVALGAGAVWVADAGDGTLHRIDPATAKRVTTIRVGQPLTDVAFGLGAVWASSAASGLLIRVDPSTNRIVEALSVGNGPSSIAIGDGAVWIANPPDNTVSRIDPASGAIRKIAVAHPGDLSVADGALWVARSERLDVAQVDMKTGAVLRRISIGAPAAAVTAAGRNLAIATLATAAAHRGGTLRVVGGEGLDSIDPGAAWSRAGWQVLSLVYDGLITYARSAGPAGAAIVPDLATSLPVSGEGGRSYTFRLRSGVRYSTGAPVRPEDFRSALERQYRAGTGLAELGVPIRGAAQCSQSRCDLSAGIVVDDRSRTITFRLTRPDPRFLFELALPFGAAVPGGSPAIGAGAAPLPGTGPYRITRFRPDRTVVLRRNRGFHAWSATAQPGGFPDSITIAAGLDAGRQSAAVTTGEADVMLDTPPADALAQLMRSRPLALHAYADSTVRAMFLNTRLAPFDRPAVRRALSLAVDRSAIVAIAGGPRLARPSCQILPPGFPGYRPFCPSTSEPGPAGAWRAPDLTRARQLIAASGTRGMAVSVSTDIRDPGKLAVGRYFVRLLEQLGYRASLRRYAGAHAYYSAIGTAQSRSQIGVFDWTADYQAGSNFFQLFTCGANLNVSGLCDPALDREIDEATRLQATNAAAANTAWQAVDREITMRSPWVPLVNPLGVDYVSARVGNYQRHPAFGLLLDRVWVR